MTDELTYERAARRIARLMIVIGALGTFSAWGFGGWRTSAGFFVGAVISGLNFIWLRRLVDGLSPDSERQTGWVRLALRYLLLGFAGYVIFRFARIGLTAVLAGVFVLTAAVFIEVAIEIVYARK
jgi:hypothetical protein